MKNDNSLRKMFNFFLRGNKPLAELVLILVGFCFPLALVLLDILFSLKIEPTMYYFSLAVTCLFAGMSALVEFIRAKEHSGLRKIYALVSGLFGMIFFWGIALLGLILTVLEIK